MTRYRGWLPYAYLVLCAVLATIGYGSGNIIGEGAADLHVAPVRFMQSLAFTWDSRMYLGNHNGFTQVYLTPYSWLYALGELMRVNPEIVQRTVLFLIYAWIACGAYWALKYISPGISVFGRLCCASAYLFNIYVAFNSNGAVAMLLTYASTPLIIGSLAAVMTGEWGIFAGAIAIAGAVFFGSGNNPPLIAINVAVAVCYLAVRIILTRSRLQQLRRAAAISVSASIASVLLNLYWIVPFVDYIRTVWLPGLLDESPAMHNLDSSFSRVLLGFGQWGIFQSDISGPWYAWAHAYTQGAFVFTLWIIVVCAFATPLFRRARTDATAFFFAIAAISIPCAVGYYSGPIGPALTAKIYDFFYNDVPGFQMFRSSYKWVWPYEFAVAGLFGIFAHNLYLAIRERLHAKPSRDLRFSFAAYGALGLVLLLPAIAYSPVIVFKANYAMPPLPNWILQEGRIAGTDQNSRIALFPSQYLEQFIWGRPWYYLEHGVFERPVTFGYLGGASNQAADEWLRFAYQRVREGDPSALDAFRILSASTILQRDDFRSDIDFAFPTLGVSANTTLSHDMISRILRANQYARVGASRFYHVAGALPIVYGVTHAQIDNGPAMSVAQSSDVGALAKGRAVVNADRIAVSSIREALADGLIGSRDTDSIRDLSTTSMYRVSPHVEIQRPGQSVSISASGWYSVVAVKKDPSQDDVLGPIGVDGKHLFPNVETSTNWTYYGMRYLRAGRHAVSADGAGYVTPILLAFIPQRDWQRRFEVLSALMQRSDADSFTVPVLGQSTTIRVARAGIYRISAQPQRILSADQRSEYVGPPESSTPQIPAGSRTIALPYVPSEGVVPTLPEPLPMSWLAQAQTYDWSRGAAVTWWMLKRVASFSFDVPDNASQGGQLHLRLSNIGPRPHLLNLFLNGRTLSQVQLPAGNTVGSGTRAALAGYVSYPIDVSVPLTHLQAGMNRLSIVSDNSPGVPAKRISDATGTAQDDLVAAIAPDMSFMVRSGANAIVKFSATEPVEVERAPSFTRVFLARTSASPGFALVALPLTSVSLIGDPFLAGALRATLPRGSHAWIAEMACNDVSGSTQYRVWPIASGHTDLNIALAQSLKNSQSDAAQRLCGLWLALSLDHAMRGQAALPYVLVQQLSVLRWLWPENVVATLSLPSGADYARAKRQGANLLFTYPRGVHARDLHIALPTPTSGLERSAQLEFVAFAKGVNFRMSLEGRTSNGWRLMGITTPLTAPIVSGGAGGTVRYHYSFPGTRFLQPSGEQAPSRYELVVDGRVFKDFRVRYWRHSGLIKAIDVTMPNGVKPKQVQFTEVPATWTADYGTLKLLSVPRLTLQSILARAPELRLTLSVSKQKIRTFRSIIVSPPRLIGDIGTSGIQHVPLVVDGKRTGGGAVHLSSGDHHIASALRYEKIATLSMQSAHAPQAHVLPLHANRTSPVSLDVSSDRPLSSFLLVFGESYHPHWKAFLRGKELTHVEANGFANGWLVPRLRPGDLITVRFTEQRWFVAAVWVSIVSGVAFLGYLGFVNVRRRRAA